ncbi:MAG: DUF1492 domain-containing protein [Clostridiales bacterium]|nr:DUF1492 domain-containing protein [Clostridiales bacterium]
MTQKEYLNQYRAIDKEIDALLDEQKRLRSIAEKSGASSIIDGTAKSPKNDNSAPFERIVDKIIEIENEINQKIDLKLNLQKEINASIERVDDDTLRTLLRYRYLCGMTFEQVAVRMNYSYMHTCRLHGRALAKIEGARND